MGGRREACAQVPQRQRGQLEVLVVAGSTPALRTPRYPQMARAAVQTGRCAGSTPVLGTADTNSAALPQMARGPVQNRADRGSTPRSGTLDARRVTNEHYHQGN